GLRGKGAGPDRSTCRRGHRGRRPRAHRPRHTAAARSPDRRRVHRGGHREDRPPGARRWAPDRCGSYRQRDRRARLLRSRPRRPGFAFTLPGPRRIASNGADHHRLSRPSALSAASGTARAILVAWPMAGGLFDGRPPSMMWRNPAGHANGPRQGTPLRRRDRDDVPRVAGASCWLSWGSFLVVGMVALATGCMIGPDFKSPKAPIAEQWLEAHYRAIDASHQEYQDWWSVFDDSALTRLIQTAYEQNLTLQAAGVRVVQARAELGVALGELYPQQQQVSAEVSRNRIPLSVPYV